MKPPGQDALLKRVSRSFYLSLKVLPASVRGQVGLAYLIARAADTLADTEAVPADERLSLLAALRRSVMEARGAALVSLLAGRVRAGSEAERELLTRLGACLDGLGECEEADRRLIARVLDQLITGMERDLRRFPRGAAISPAEVVALATWQDLDEYTYLAAGCVGEFWTDITARHLPEVAHLRGAELRRRGVCLGKALQLVNVLRDVPADLRIGRCYWPIELLNSYHLDAEGLARLVQPGAAVPSEEVRQRVLGATSELVRRARTTVDEAWPYVQAIPARALRLRMSAAWPLLIGLDTLAMIEKNGSPLLASTQVLKVRRAEVHGMVLRSTAAGLLDGITGRGARLDRLMERRAAG